MRRVLSDNWLAATLMFGGLIGVNSTAAGIYGIRQLQRVRRGGLRKGPPRRTAVAGADGREGENLNFVWRLTR